MSSVYGICGTRCFHAICSFCCVRIQRVSAKGLLDFSWLDISSVGQVRWAAADYEDISSLHVILEILPWSFSQEVRLDVHAHLSTVSHYSYVHLPSSFSSCHNLPLSLLLPAVIQPSSALHLTRPAMFALLFLFFFFSVADFNYVSRMSCYILNKCCILHETGHTNKNPTGISQCCLE